MEKDTEYRGENNPRYLPDETKRSYAFSIWLGALIRWFLSAGTKKFDKLYTPESNTKNLIIGYLSALLMVTMLMTVILYSM